MVDPKTKYLPVLLFIFLIGLLVLCLWLILRPKEPGFTITDISLPTSTDQNSSFCQDGGSIYYVLEIKNPNKDSSIYYDNLTLTLHYNEDTVGTNTISHFHQGKDKTREVIEHFDAKGNLWKALMRSIRNSTTNLKVNLEGGLRYRTWGIKSKHNRLNLQGTLPIGSDGKISGKKKKIKLKSSKKQRVKAARFH